MPFDILICSFVLYFVFRLFLSKVEEKFPKEAELIVACQKGLRYLIQATGLNAKGLTAPD